MGLEQFIELYDVPVELGDETVGGFTHTTRFATTTDGKDVILKYSSDSDHILLIEREYEACDILSAVLHNNTDVNIPEPVIYVREGEEILVGFERLETYTPTRKDWEDIEFCGSVIDSVAELFNELHTNMGIYERIFNSDHCSDYVNRISDSMVANAEMVSYEGHEQYEELVNGCIEYIRGAQNNSEIRFSHQDFSVVNLAFSEEGLYAVFDWENCGFFDPMRDIALFESAIIEEFILEIHPERAESFRNRFRSQLEIDIDEDRVKAYKFVQLYIVLQHILDGDCTDMWLELGTWKDARDQKLRLLDELENNIRDIIY